MSSALLNGKLRWKLYSSIPFIGSPVNCFCQFPYPQSSHLPGLMAFLCMLLPDFSSKGEFCPGVRSVGTPPERPCVLPFPLYLFISPFKTAKSVPIFWIIREMREVAVLSGQFFVERRKCDGVFYWPTSKCYCLSFPLFQGLELGGHASPSDAW